MIASSKLSWVLHAALVTSRTFQRIQTTARLPGPRRPFRSKLIDQRLGVLGIEPNQFLVPIPIADTIATPFFLLGSATLEAKR